MKILHISFMDDSPGANRAAYRLHKALLRRNLKSTFITLNKLTNDDSVIEHHAAIRNIAALATEAFCEKIFKRDARIPFSFNIVPKITLNNTYLNTFDIVQLHWLGRSTLDLKSLAAFRGPIVWRLPDMYPFTAGCHYSGACMQYINGCSSCNQLRIPNFAKFLFSQKMAHISQIRDLHIVSPSTWLYESTLNAMALDKHQKHHIGTGINTKIFSPINKRKALKALHLSNLADKNIILFGAISSTADPRKGFSELFEALKFLSSSPPKHSYEVVVFGSENDPKIKLDFTNVTFLGTHYNEEAMATIYNAADLMVVPSTEENLPNTAIEAMACGKPVVAFNIGGLPDLIVHKQNGYLADPIDVKDLAEGMRWVLNHSNDANLGNNARQAVLKRFDEKDISKKYEALYSSLLASR